MTDIYPRPQGVRIERRDGRVIPCDLWWAGLSADGMAQWRVGQRIKLQDGDRLHVDEFPARTCILWPGLSPSPPKPWWRRLFDLLFL